VARGREIAGESNGKLCPAICQHVAMKRPLQWERDRNGEKWEVEAGRTDGGCCTHCVCHTAGVMAFP